MRRRDLIAATLAAAHRTCRAGRTRRRWCSNSSRRRAARPAHRPMPCSAACATVRRDRARLGTSTTGTTSAGAIGSPQRRRPLASRPMRGSSAARCSPRRSWSMAATLSSARSARRSRRRSKVPQPLPVAGDAQPLGRRLGRGDRCCTRGPVRVAARRVRPGASHRRRRRRERRPAPARVPDRARGRDAGRLGRHRTTDDRTGRPVAIRDW